MTEVDEAPRAVRATDPPGRTFAYQPALDGVRAVAVLAVLLFHAEVAGFSGGYLGVSVFFTLSGFLITSLLVTEVERDGRVGVAAFYARRARRLLPASLLCIVGIVVISSVTTWFDAVSTLRRDVLGSLFQVANWVFLFGGGSYQELFDASAGSVSPLEHYWSLAIEEQFYWLWPIAFVGLGVLAGHRAGRRRSLVLGLTVVAAIAAPVIAAVWGPDAAYWSTPARIAEILMGASLAVLIAGRRVPNRWGVLAPLALLGLAVMVVTFPAAGGPAYSGALPLVAVVSAALLLGLQAEGPTRQALSARPLVWLGSISYGVYLYHWPVYVVLDEARVGTDGLPLLALRLAVTLAIAQLSFVLLERPVRRARAISRRTTLLGGLGLTAAAAVVAVAVVPASGAGYWTIDDEVADATGLDVAGGSLVPLTPTVTTEAPVDTTDVAETVAVEPDVTVAVEVEPEPTTVATTTGPPSTVATTVSPEPEVAVVADDAALPAQPPLPASLPRPVRIVVAGDSTAEATGLGVLNWAAAESGVAAVEVFDAPGCGFVRGGVYLDTGMEWQPGCGRWAHEALPEMVAEKQADVVALITTSWDVGDRRWPDGLEGSVLDPDVAAYVESELRDVTQDFLDRGITVVWLRNAIPHPQWLEEEHETEDPARHEVMYRIMDDIAADHPGDVYVVDVAGHTEDLEFSREARPDGVHWAPEVATAIAEDYLGEQLIRAALDLEPR